MVYYKAPGVHQCVHRQMRSALASASCRVAKVNVLKSQYGLLTLFPCMVAGAPFWGPLKAHLAAEWVKLASAAQALGLKGVSCCNHTCQGSVP